MKQLIAILILCTFFAIQVSAQWSPEERERINKLNREDHQLMMKMLEITELRPGPSGNPESPTAANSDESKATPYASLPDPLVFNNGDPVNTAEQWEKRKLEILEDFDREIYGRVPAKTPAVSWEVVDVSKTTEGEFPVTIKQLVGHVDNTDYPSITVDIQMTLTTPRTITKPVPVIIEFGWNFPAGWGRRQQSVPTWKEQVLAKGWGYAILVPTSFQADNGAGLREGIIGLVNKGQPRKLDDWGSLRAWAWGASRAVDYFESNPDVDEKRIGIEGLSRYGKAAIVAMAYEPQISIGFIGSSGAGGAKILRRVFGEQVENLASSGEYHWFAPNFIKYAGPLTPMDLPADAHQLVALCAPRPVFISVGSPTVEGQWIDGRGMFLAGVHASPVYELLGKKGIGAKDYPAQEAALIDGEIAFRQHAGGHTVGPNWPVFIKYAEMYFQ